MGIAICAVLATALAFSIQLWAQQFTSSSHAAILFTLEPVFASVTSYILFHERLGHRAFSARRSSWQEFSSPKCLALQPLPNRPSRLPNQRELSRPHE